MGDDDSAGAAIRGSYTPQEQMPDRDLGRCIKPGRGNNTSETRAFGKPSRVAPPRPRSQGAPFFCPPPRGPTSQPSDDGSTANFLVPDRFLMKGISSGEFSRLRSRDE